LATGKKLSSFDGLTVLN